MVTTRSQWPWVPRCVRDRIVVGSEIHARSVRLEIRNSFGRLLRISSPPHVCTLCTCCKQIMFCTWGLRSNTTCSRGPWWNSSVFDTTVCGLEVFVILSNDAGRVVSTSPVQRMGPAVWPWVHVSFLNRSNDMWWQPSRLIVTTRHGFWYTVYLWVLQWLGLFVGYGQLG